MSLKISESCVSATQTIHTDSLGSYCLVPVAVRYVDSPIQSEAVGYNKSVSRFACDDDAKLASESNLARLWKADAGAGSLAVTTLQTSTVIENNC